MHKLYSFLFSFIYFLSKLENFDTSINEQLQIGNIDVSFTINDNSRTVIQINLSLKDVEFYNASISNGVWVALGYNNIQSMVLNFIFLHSIFIT